MTQIEVHRNLAAELAAPHRFEVPVQRTPQREVRSERRRRSRLLTHELPALIGAVIIAATGITISAGTAPTTPAAPQARQIGCVQDVSGTGCLVPTPAAQGTPLYVDPTTPAARQVEEWTAQGRTADADALRALSGQAVPLWLTGADGTRSRVAGYSARAAAAGAVPLFVAYNIPDRDCGSFSGGGAADADAYRAWVASVAAGLGGTESIVVLEPDAISHQLTGCAEAGSGDRYELLAGAVDAFAAAGAQVYIDAGNPGFTGDAAATADALERAGIDRAAGFSLNVANFYTTEASVAYGTEISAALGGEVHFVVDTSRNGAGRPADPTDGAPIWCNPPGRLLGAAPTLDTGIPLVDGLLWIKRPGESDGSCRPDEPVAGGWFPDYALDLVTP
ncbi:glycoside hydrolase family 6 protein [Pseudonocardia abyssalis]|uniref:Glycoside hydrolase family 6 protein n=1 Tax=Pseudonocardia abyssalis TaxID=2792008 RepID=A0ABS6UWV6_9PSEU|nr:glycoside hydrolase family 6 protein [Pseudonocardia abyssalis]MBW0115991.1 glycoside hydrolase family 6 protein [Pseudonocardia abyssalis]MBW0136745.1 glycoside hydrolase family 6 protein [Pseudonocardia abyssalis]